MAKHALVVGAAIVLALGAYACRQPDITQRKKIGVEPVGADIGYQRPAAEYKGNPSASAMRPPE